METVSRQIVVMDFPGIKSFVFGTDRLVEVRGASALLDQLNRQYIPQEMTDCFGRQRCRVVFAGGGAAQIIVESSPEALCDVVARMQGEVYRQSGGALRLVVGLAPYPNGDVAGGYQAALNQAFLNLEAFRQQQPFETGSTLHCGYVRECDSCSGMAETESRYGGDARLLCHTCLAKEEAGWQRGLWRAYRDYLITRGAKPEETATWQPRDFEEIGRRCQARPGYTALVYGDGNAMGRLVKQMDTPERFERFSQVVDTAVREACHEALEGVYGLTPLHGRLPADILLLGGDDVMIYLTADQALPFAMDVAQRFEAKTAAALGGDDFFRTRMGGRGLTLSLGIAYGRAHTPIAIMVEQAEELLRSAKQKGAMLAGHDAWMPACLDFHLSSHFNQVRVADSRRQHLMQPTPAGGHLRLYYGPYTLTDARKLWHHAGTIHRSAIPRSRLHRLGQAPFLGKINATIDTMALIGRCRKTTQSEALIGALEDFDCTGDLIPWCTADGDSTTVLTDLMAISELYPPKEVFHAPSHTD